MPHLEFHLGPEREAVPRAVQALLPARAEPVAPLGLRLPPLRRQRRRRRRLRGVPPLGLRAAKPVRQIQSIDLRRYWFTYF